MSGRPTALHVRLLTLSVSLGLTTILAACGVAKAPEEPAAKPVQLTVSPARFSSTEQFAGEEVTLSLTVKNSGSNPVANVIVQLKGLAETTLADPKDAGRDRTSKTDLPDAVDRAAWFIDEGPDGPPLSSSFLFPGGPLEPGRTRTLRWRLSPAKAGKFSIGYQVFGGLTDNEAKGTSGTGLTGSVSATITDR